MEMQTEKNCEIFANSHFYRQHTIAVLLAAHNNVEGLTESNWYMADILLDPNRKVETKDSIWENKRTKRTVHKKTHLVTDRTYN